MEERKYGRSIETNMEANRVDEIQCVLPKQRQILQHDSETAKTIFEVLGPWGLIRNWKKRTVQADG